jgi:hypothetical protein
MLIKMARLPPEFARDVDFVHSISIPAMQTNDARDKKG